MKQEIYGWHIIHNPTGLPVAFCSRVFDGKVLTENEVLEDFENPEELTLIPLVRAGSLQ